VLAAAARTDETDADETDADEADAGMNATASRAAAAAPAMYPMRLRSTGAMAVERDLQGKRARRIWGAPSTVVTEK
jgi:hypothetical protein